MAAVTNVASEVILFGVVIWLQVLIVDDGAGIDFVGDSGALGDMVRSTKVAMFALAL